MNRLLPLITAASLSAITMADVIPPVPIEVMRQGVPAPVRAATPAQQSAPAQPAQQGLQLTDAVLMSDNRVLLQPGINVVIPVAVNHLNRLVTPFGRPDVRYLDESLAVDVKDNVVYVAPSERDKPITLFIREQGDESMAMSLTLWPQIRPAREVTLNFVPESQATVTFQRPNAERWEQSQPYVTTIRNLFAAIAQQQLPPGYKLSTPNAQDLDQITCMQAGMRFEFDKGQVVDGSGLRVIIGQVTNTSANRNEFREENCANWQVAAVAAWPHVLLEPGQTTEVYVALKDNKQPMQPLRRPSLIGN